MNKLSSTVKLIFTYILTLNYFLLSSAQTPGTIANPLEVVNQQLRDMFTPLHRPTPLTRISI
jgi:hypothetical protein